jgi:hypothetical protein
VCLGDLEEEQHTLLAYSYRLRSFSAERRHANTKYHPVKKVAAHPLHVWDRRGPPSPIYCISDGQVVRVCRCRRSWCRVLFLAGQQQVEKSYVSHSAFHVWETSVWIFPQLPKRKLCPIPILLRVLLACLSCFPLWLCFFYGITTTSPQTTAAAGLLQSARAEYF